LPHLLLLLTRHQSNAIDVPRDGAFPAAHTQAYAQVHHPQRVPSRMKRGVSPPTSPSFLSCAVDKRGVTRLQPHISRQSTQVSLDPKSGSIAATHYLTSRANSDSCAAAKVAAYSITSSATVSSLIGIVKPSALAVLRLITIWKWVGCSTGRSAGLAPFNILST
jgi:hypothetical protein